MEKDISSIIFAILEDRCGVDSHSVTTESGLDYSILERLTLGIENKLMIRIPVEEAKEIGTIGNLIKDCSIRKILVNILESKFDVDRYAITRETLLNDGDYLDSLDSVEFVMEVEKAFNITIPDDKAEKLKTVGDYIDYIKVIKS